MGLDDNIYESKYYYGNYKKYSDKPWDWDWISSNPNITMEIIEKYPDKPWNWNFISSESKYYYGNYRKISR